MTVYKYINRLKTFGRSFEILWIKEVISSLSTLIPKSPPFCSKPKLEVNLKPENPVKILQAKCR